LKLLIIDTLQLHPFFSVVENNLKLLIYQQHLQSHINEKLGNALVVRMGGVSSPLRKKKGKTSLEDASEFLNF
jgi:hypothetical protein